MNMRVCASGGRDAVWLVADDADELALMLATGALPAFPFPPGKLKDGTDIPSTPRSFAAALKPPTQ